MNAFFPDPTLPPILLVDDCEDDIFLLRLRLRDGGITNPIMAFRSAGDTLRYLDAVRDTGQMPALIFVDIKMPGGSGFQLIQTVREVFDMEDVRIVVATASNQPADLERALELGVNGYLIKFPSAELLAEFVHHGPWFAVPRGSPVVAHALSA